MKTEDLQLKAIPTVYKGVQMRSRMEAQCAVLFDKLGWEWEYEKFSLMLPSGISYIPDFWIDTPWIISECRGYESERGQRQIEEFASLVEKHHGFEVSDEFGNVSQFLVIGPERVTLYSASKRNNGIPIVNRQPYEFGAPIVHLCGCGWRMLGENPWCPNCEQLPVAAVVLSVKTGKLYINGTAVEDWDWK